MSFAWYIAKALQAAGARLFFAVHPRLVDIVENILEREPDAPSRVLPYGAGDLQVEKVIACDVGFDTMDDVDEKTRNDRRFAKRGDYSIQGMLTTFKTLCNQIDILIHSVAFSPEITNLAIDTSRKAYLTALSISAYSLTALLRACQPLMENRPGGAVAVGLTYLGGERVVPHYGGGMSTAKAALQIDAKQLASNLGPKNIRVNLISAGPYASRAASAIGKGDHPEDDRIRRLALAAAARHRSRGGGQRRRVPVQPAGVGDHRRSSVRRLRLQRDGVVRRAGPFKASWKARDLQAAAAEIEMLRGRGAARRMENVGVQAVDDESALLFVQHDAGVPEDAQVVRDVDDLGPHQAGDFADVAGAVAQAVDDPQPLRVGQRPQHSGAMVGFQRIGHAWGLTVPRRGDGDSVPSSRIPGRPHPTNSTLAL